MKIRSNQGTIPARPSLIRLLTVYALGSVSNWNYSTGTPIELVSYRLKINSKLNINEDGISRRICPKRGDEMGQASSYLTAFRIGNADLTALQNFSR